MFAAIAVYIFETRREKGNSEEVVDKYTLPKEVKYLFSLLPDQTSQTPKQHR